MKTCRYIAGLALVAAVLVATDAPATTLVSGVISFEHTPGNRLVCTVTNAGAKPITLESGQLFFGGEPPYTGQQNAATSCGTSLAPGDSCLNELTGSSGDCFYCYCKVSFTGSKKGVRAVLTRQVYGDTVVAVPLN